MTAPKELKTISKSIVKFTIDSSLSRLGTGKFFIFLPYIQFSSKSFLKMKSGKLATIFAVGLIIQFFHPINCDKSIVVSANDEKLMRSIANQLVGELGPHRNDLIKWAKTLISEQHTRADFLTCEICLPALQIIRPWVNIIPIPLLVGAVTLFCEILDLAPSPDLCGPTIANFANPVIHIVKTKTPGELSNNDLCGIINPGCTPVDDKYTKWNINIAGGKPPLANPPLLDASVKGVQILQFTDIHLDLDYDPNGFASCDYPICCRNDTKPIGDSKELAGVFGNYNCALPERALDEIYKHAKETYPDVKYIFLTGDYIHSGVWLYNEKENGRHIESVTLKLAETFPNVKIFPLTGNHEAAPCNMYPPPDVWNGNDKEFDLEWMYTATSRAFTGLFEGQPEQARNFHYGGYYTLRPDPASKLRLVVLNTNLCYINNFWLAFDPIDPTGQLQWFADTMKLAEDAEEHVLILAHISPGSGSCWPVWSNFYDAIVNRFENIIRGQFYGHSHNEYFTLAFQRDTDRPTSVLHVGPSMVTDGMNSGYKVYYADGDRGMDSTWEIVDHETWLLNTKESNIANVPIFEKLFTAKETFGMESLRPEAYYDLVQRMICDNELFEKFELIHFKNSTSLSKFRPCSMQANKPACIVNRLCNTVEAYSGDSSHCDRLWKLMDDYLLKPTECPVVPTTPGDTTTPAVTTTPSVTTTPTVPTTEGSGAGHQLIGFNLAHIALTSVFIVYLY